MTREQAIKILNKYDLNFCDIDGNPIPPQDLAEAFDMAIQALQQQTCDNCKFNEETDGMNCYECVKGISDNFEALEQEPKPSEIARDIATIIENEQDMRVIEHNHESKWIPCSEGLTVLIIAEK